MTSRIRDWRSSTVLVVGDVMLDRYWDGTTARISPEAPVPVVRVGSESERVGGAANVAANVAALGITTTLIGSVGTDPAGQQLAALCRAQNIDAQFAKHEHVETTVKLRVLSQHQQLIRLDFEGRSTDDDAQRLSDLYHEHLTHADIVVLSDYAKGVLSNSQALIAAAREIGKRVIVDPKSTDFSRYAGAYLITPNIAEFEACVGRCADEREIEYRGLALCDEHDIEALLITRGDLGMMLIAPQIPAYSIPARAREVFDVTGAGDTVCAVLSSALAAGEELIDAMHYANAAAGVAVGKVGTAIVTIDEIEHALSLNAGGGQVDLTTLIGIVADAKRRGERIVVTNGCFDIVHAGHVAYLEQAKMLGTKLIVALNSDASVARLKGPTRPVNRLKDRMAVVAALGAVDWVVSFDEDDPKTLIEALSPDILVKGGDYQAADIVGGEHVLRSGGKVIAVPYIDGVSTTLIVEKLAGKGTAGR